MAWERKMMRTVRVRNEQKVGTLARLLAAISSMGASVGSIEMLNETAHSVVRDITVYADDAEHKGKEVWSSVLNGKSDVWSHDRLHLYRFYPEKIVSPEGDLLARMRLTPTDGEEVIPVEKK